MLPIFLQAEKYAGNIAMKQGSAAFSYHELLDESPTSARYYDKSQALFKKNIFIF